jgi:apolipoprotein N-acyltransferase
MITTCLSFCVSFLSGCFYALCYPSFLGSGWFLLLFFSLPIFLWKLESSASLKISATHVLIFNLGLNLFGYYWIPHTLREFGQLPYLFSIILGLLFTVILQPHWWFYILWKKFRPQIDWNSESGLIITAAILTLLERYVPQQFPSYVGSPWLHLTPYLGLAPYGGVAVFSFITYWVTLETFTQFKIKIFRPFVWSFFGAFLLLNAAFPLKNRESDKKLPVRIVQANIGNFLKIQSEKGEVNSYEFIRKKYEDLSSTFNGFQPKLIVWPETAYPDTFFGYDTELDPTFLRIMNKTNAEMLIGGYNQNSSKPYTDIIESVYNSSILLSDNKFKASYHKNILIPFGETLPFGPLNSHVISIIPAVSLFARGQGTPLLETRDGYRFVTPICYEILESNYMRQLLNQWGKNNLIINHTNDSWYGKTAEPYQHLFLSKWRALEFKIPIVRTTNTGISSVIYPDGTESGRLLTDTEGILDIEVPLAAGKGTFYQIYGINPLLGLIVLILFISSIKKKLSQDRRIKTSLK